MHTDIAPVIQVLSTTACTGCRLCGCCLALSCSIVHSDVANIVLFNRTKRQQQKGRIHKGDSGMKRSKDWDNSSCQWPANSVPGHFPGNALSCPFGCRWKVFCSLHVVHCLSLLRASSSFNLVCHLRLLFSLHYRSWSPDIQVFHKEWIGCWIELTVKAETFKRQPVASQSRFLSSTFESLGLKRDILNLRSPLFPPVTNLLKQSVRDDSMFWTRTNGCFLF